LYELLRKSYARTRPRQPLHACLVASEAEDENEAPRRRICRTASRLCQSLLEISFGSEADHLPPDVSRNFTGPGFAPLPRPISKHLLIHLNLSNSGVHNSRSMSGYPNTQSMTRDRSGRTTPGAPSTDSVAEPPHSLNLCSGLSGHSPKSFDSELSDKTPW
jgi:hypothetical protein